MFYNIYCTSFKLWYNIFYIIWIFCNIFGKFGWKPFLLRRKNSRNVFILLLLFYYIFLNIQINLRKLDVNTKNELHTKVYKIYREVVVFSYLYIKNFCSFFNLLLPLNGYFDQLLKNKRNVLYFLEPKLKILEFFLTFQK